MESGKPTVLILLSGSALAINWADENVDAIIYGGYPGAQGGRAIAKILFGESSPEGKLPITFYRTTEELPEFTDYSMQGRTYRYMKQEALYPFGYGMSYSEFQIENITLSTDRITKDGVVIQADITNTGMYDAAETLQVYVKAERENAPNPQLKGLKKVFLQQGETVHVSISLKEEAFALCDETGKKEILAGDYKIYVGTSQPDSRSTALLKSKPVCFTARV